METEQTFLKIFPAVWQSESDCQKFAQQCAKLCLPGSSIGIIGELGAGKTTFVRYLVQALQSDDIVSSPTYVLQHEYRCAHCLVDHWDLYRLQEAPEELFIKPDPSTVRIVEWPDLFPELYPALDYVLQISMQVEGEIFIRRVTARKSDHPQSL